ncbi:E3 ubiquitin-protein ligase znrf1 [Larimichthys crocea]|uniref:E3 ubiquitin-protein ligase znrf1 n=1 Tax=Larimichthys crocea TaxID=215358 RepID=UPI000F5DA4A0|nr:E3 ubiquitin-protein ligase znrf1 [Larimichthys crocea]
MGGKQSTAGRPRGAFPGVSTDDSAVPPSAHFGHYRPSGTMGLRSRSVSSVAGMGIEHSPAVPFGFYTPRGTDSDRAGGGGGGGSGGTTAGTPHGGGTGGYQETGGGGHHTDGVLYLGSRGSLADTLPLHIAPRWFSAHSGFKCPVCSKSVASNEMEVHFIMCLSKPRLSYNGRTFSLFIRPPPTTTTTTTVNTTTDTNVVFSARVGLADFDWRHNDFHGSLAFPSDN